MKEVKKLISKVQLYSGAFHHVHSALNSYWSSGETHRL